MLREGALGTSVGLHQSLGMKGGPHQAQTGPRRRRKGTGNRAKIHAQRGAGGRFSCRPTPYTEQTREPPAFRGARTPQPRPFLGVVRAPPPRHSHWERTRGALPWAATTAVPLAWSPPSGRSKPRTRAPARQPQPPLPPAAAARCELKEQGRRTAPLSQPRVRARQPLSLRPGLSFPPRKWVQSSPSSRSRRGAPTGSSPPAGPRVPAAHSPLPS